MNPTPCYSRARSAGGSGGKRGSFPRAIVAACAALPVSLFLPVPGSTRAEEFAVPGDARVARVTDYGARPDDGKDVTEALQAAISKTLETNPSRYRSPRMIYLPAGTYDIRGPLEARTGKEGWSLGWRAGFVLIGQSREKTILKLADNAPGFGDPKKPQAVLKTGSEMDKGEHPDGGGNRAFRHSIRNLTIDSGRGNPGAVGIDFVASNRGAIHDVTVRSGDGAGHAGILLTRAWPGPCLMKSIHITGFDYGFRVSHYQYGVAFEHIALERQNVAGIENAQNVLAIRGLISDNAVPAIRATSEHGHIVLVDSELRGGAAGASAIQSKATLFVRNITSSGYGTIIEDQSGTKRNVPGGRGRQAVDEYVSHPALSAPAAAQKTSLNLPVEETPTYSDANVADWANVEKFGAKAGDNADDADALQRAIDSGKAVVYLPNGDYHASRPIVIRGNTRKIIGFEGAILKAKGAPAGPVFRFEGKNATVIEHLYFDGMEHASGGTLAMSHCDVRFYSNTPAGTGKMFFEDVLCKPVKILHPQKVWARQLNSEFGDQPLIQNHGGTLWILLFKTEGEMVCLETVRGTTELLGALLYPLKKVPAENAAFVNDNGRVSLTFALNGSHHYPVLVRGKREDAQSELTRKEIRGRGVALYVDRP